MNTNEDIFRKKSLQILEPSFLIKLHQTLLPYINSALYSTSFEMNQQPCKIYFLSYINGAFIFITERKMLFNSIQTNV